MNDTEREQRRRMEVLRTYEQAAKAGYKQTIDVLRADSPELRHKFDQIDKRVRYTRGRSNLDSRDYQEATEA